MKRIRAVRHLAAYAAFTLFAFCGCVLFSTRAAQAANAASHIRSVRATGALPVEAKRLDKAWLSGRIDGQFEDLTTRAPAAYNTEVFMLYDASNIYVAFHCEQSGTPITATQITDDVGLGLDDFVGIGIDTSGDGSQVYYFETTPRGTRYQLASEDARFRPMWHSAAAVEGSSWTAMMVIPLKALRIRNIAHQAWRINFFRNLSALGEHYTWAYDPLMQDAAPGQQWPVFNYMRFWPSWTGLSLDSSMQHVREPGVSIYAIQSIGRDRAAFFDVNGAPFTHSAHIAGVDVNYPLTSTINFVGTLNPDFSNVEIDQQTVAPQEFRRSLREYRPFFTQGAPYLSPNFALITSLTSYPNQIFYSPSIASLDRGAKIEGTFGDQSFGVMKFSGNDYLTSQTFDDLAYGYKHALHDDTFLYWTDGVFANHRATGFDGTYEYGVGGRDLRTGFVYGFDQSNERSSQLPAGRATSTNGFVDVQKKNYEAQLGYVQISPYYNPVDGFTSISDIKGINGYLNLLGKTQTVKNWSLFAGMDRYVDESGAVHEADVGVFLNATLKNGISIDGLGPVTSELRSYSATSDCSSPRSYFSGSPTYYCPRTDTFNLFSLPFGYKDGTPTPIDASVTFGRFGSGMVGPTDQGADFLHLYSVSTSRQVTQHVSVGLEYDGSVERAVTTGLRDSQSLRRISLTMEMGRLANLSVSYRNIVGTGGFAEPGSNLALAFHKRFRQGDDLFVNFGTPAASQTVDRAIVKYVFHFGNSTQE